MALEADVVFQGTAQMTVRQMSRYQYHKSIISDLQLLNHFISKYLLQLCLASRQHICLCLGRCAISPSSQCLGRAITVMLRGNQTFLPFLLILLLSVWGKRRKKFGLSNNVGGFLGVLKGSIQQIKTQSSGIFILYWNHQASFYFFRCLLDIYR